MKKKYTVLVVDDAFFIRNLIKRAVGNKPSVDYDYEFELVGEGLNGEEGLLLYKSLRPDIVTADINMGSLGGVKFIKAVQKINPKAKIIIISSSLDNKIKSEVAELGCYYIQKPFQEAYLWTKLDTIAEELMREGQTKKTNNPNPAIKQEKTTVIEKKENNEKEKGQLIKENEKSFHKNKNNSNENKNKSQLNKNKQNKKKENNENNKNNNHKKVEKQNVLAGFVVEDGLSIHTLKNNTQPNGDKSATVKQNKQEPHKKKEQSKNNAKKESSKEVVKAPKPIPTLEVVEDIVIPPRKVVKDIKANIKEVKRVEPELNDLGLYECNEVLDLDVKPRKTVQVKPKINKPIKEETNAKKNKEIVEVVENKALEVIPAEIEEIVLVVEESSLEMIEPVIEEVEVKNEPSIIELDNTTIEEAIIIEDEIMIEDEISQETNDNKDLLICEEENEVIVLDDESDLLIIDEIETKEESKEEEIVIMEALEDEDLFIIEQEEANQDDNEEDFIVIEDSAEELVIIEEEEELMIEDDEDELIILEEEEQIESIIKEDVLIFEEELVIEESEPEISIEETDTIEIEFEDEVLEETENNEENSIENELLMGLSYDLDVELTQRKPQSNYNPKSDFEFSIEEEFLKQETTSSYEHKSEIENKPTVDEEVDDYFNFSDTGDSDTDDDDWDLFSGEMDLEFDISNEYDSDSDKNMYDNTDYTINMELNHDDFDYNKAYTSNRANGAVKISPPKDNVMKEIYSKRMEEEYSIGFKKEEPVTVEEPVEQKKVGLFSKIFKRRKRT